MIRIGGPVNFRQMEAVHSSLNRLISSPFEKQILAQVKLSVIFGTDFNIE